MIALSLGNVFSLPFHMTCSIWLKARLLVQDSRIISMPRNGYLSSCQAFSWRGGRRLIQIGVELSLIFKFLQLYFVFRARLVCQSSVCLTLSLRSCLCIVSQRSLCLLLYLSSHSPSSILLLFFITSLLTWRETVLGGTERSGLIILFLFLIKPQFSSRIYGSLNL